MIINQVRGRLSNMAARETETYDCDVLVIGGGLAGTWAAIGAKDYVDDVMLVDKAKVSKTGASTFAAGAMLAPQVGDDLDVWTKEILDRGNYVGDQDWIEVILHQQPKIIDELETWGVEFERDKQGRLARTVGRAHTSTQILMFHGPQFMHVMRKQVATSRIPLVERVMITDLLTSDGQCPSKGCIVGAVGFDVRSGAFQVFRAKSVVLAAGGVWGDSQCARNLTGDGIAMGYRSGAEICGMEFAHPSEGWVFDRKYKVQGMNLWQGAGMYLVNAQGERFMEKYSPVLKERAQKAELHLAVAKECVEGRGPVYIDMRHFKPEVWDRFRRVLPNFMRLAEVLEPWKRRIQFDFGTGAINAAPAGIKNNIFSETNLPGLYVAGQVSGFPGHGTYSVGGFNLAACCVGGRRAGAHAARYSKTRASAEITTDQLERLEESVYKPLSLKNGITPAALNIKIKEVAGIAESLFRSEKGINTILNGLARIKAVLPTLAARDYHELMRANELKNYLACLELIYRAALERTESRGPHCRVDHPYRDDIDWLKRVILRSAGDGNVAMRLEPIPVYRYSGKPEKFERVSPAVPPPEVK